MIVTPAYPRIIPQVQRGQVRDLDRGLVGHWPFDLDARDVSGNGNNGTPTNGPVKTKGIIRGAYRLDGVDDYISLGSGSSLAPTKNITLSAWFKTSNVGVNGLFGKGDRSTSDGGYTCVIGADGNPKFIYDDGSTQIVIATSNNFADDMWHMYTVVVGNICIVYVDNREVCREDISGLGSPNISSYVLELGKYTYNGASVNYFHGCIADCRFYNQVLPPAKIRQLYQSGASRFARLLYFDIPDFLDGKVYLFLTDTRPLDGRVDVNTPTNKLDGKADLVDSTTLPFDGKARVKDVTTVSLDGKAEVLSSSFDLIDGKTRIKDAAADLLDGKSIIKDTVINLLDGKTVVKTAGTTTNLLDGKTIIKDIVANLLDGRIAVGDVAVGLLDGKTVINNLVTNFLDGKTRIFSVSIDLLDGKAVINSGGAGVNLLDGKTRIKDSFTDFLDGKARISNVTTNLLDGKTTVAFGGLSFLDGKLYIPKLSLTNFYGKVYLLASSPKIINVMSRAYSVIFKYSEP